MLRSYTRSSGSPRLPLRQRHEAFDAGELQQGSVLREGTAAGGRRGTLKPPNPVLRHGVAANAAGDVPFGEPRLSASFQLRASFQASFEVQSGYFGRYAPARGPARAPPAPPALPSSTPRLAAFVGGGSGFSLRSPPTAGRKAERSQS